MQTTPPTPRLDVQRILPRRARRLAIVVVALLALGGALLASLTQEPMRAAIWQRLGQSCGAIAAQQWAGPNGAPMLKLWTDPATARQAEDCFMHGYTRCQAVSLAYSVGGMDSGVTDTFVVEPAEGRLAGCALAEIAQGYIVGGRTSGRTIRCARVAQQPDGLHVIGCGGGEDIIIYPEDVINPA